MSRTAKASEKIVSRETWSKHFGKWFRKVLIDGKILDYRYPIKGAGVWLPYGFKIRENVFKIIRNQLDSTGHNEALFPLLVPETSLQKEAEHVEGFEAQVFWVTQGGQKQLKQKLALAHGDNTTTASQRFTRGIFCSSTSKAWIRISASLKSRMQMRVECCG